MTITSSAASRFFVPYVEGLENPSEFPNMLRCLVAHGYGDEDVREAIGGNVLRALRDVWV